MDKIDFVVLWVDGNDPQWIAERAKYLPKEDKSASDPIRFRDWDLMRYWFRGVEKFAPWVNNIYFVTWGHYPEWLNLEHPKLKIVKHTEYIPHEYLPIFNSNTIELNLHRIDELSEHFVLFNDNMFLTKAVQPKDFFQNGLPCETVRLGQTFATSPDDVFNYTIFNNIAIINKYFYKKEVIKKHWRKFLSPKYGRENIRSILLLPFGHFSGFLDSHLPASHLKSTFKEIWNKEANVLSESCFCRFRDKKCVTHWVMKNWRFCEGQFEPRSIRWGKSYAIGADSAMLQELRKQKYYAVCLNDCDSNLDFELHQDQLKAVFEEILPEKSSFEKEK